jgi:hypothetical protein
MATVKKVLGDYTIQSIDQGNVNINTNTVTINGNMVVNGVTTTIESTNTTVYDNIVTLNGNLGPTAQPLQRPSGFEVNRGALPSAQFLWSEDLKAWQINAPFQDPGGQLSTVAIMTSSGLQINGNMDLKQYALYSTVYDKILVNTNLSVQNITGNVVPSPVAGYNTIYTNTPSAVNARDSGVFVTNTTKTGAQLATKNQALLYSLIFF